VGKDKLKRFAEIATFGNVIELEAGLPYKGEWAQQFFNNTSPVVLELACGKGEYTVNLAQLFPDKNFIGVDYKGNRIWRPMWPFCVYRLKTCWITFHPAK
jgi:tRNA (guanine-N7-)-methyltransferase